MTQPAPPVITGVTLTAALVRRGGQLTATVAYTGGSSYQTEWSASGPGTDSAGHPGEMTESFATVQPDPGQWQINDTGGAAWQLASDTGGVATFTAAAPATPGSYQVMFMLNDTATQQGAPSAPAGYTVAAPGLFGATVYTSGLATKPSTQQWAGLPGSQWAGQNVNRPVGVRKAFPGSSYPVTLSSDMQCALDLGMTCLVCYSPAYNPPTQADFDALQASLTALAAAGLDTEVILDQEIENKNLTPAQYFAMLAFYGPAVTAALGPGHLHHCSAGNYPGKWAAFMPTEANGVPAGLVADAMLDYYAKSYPKGIRIDQYIAACTAAGFRFAGCPEIGLSSTPPDNDTVLTGYLPHLQAIAEENPGIMMAWYTQESVSPYGGVPGYAAGATITVAGQQVTGPDCVPQLQQLADTITA